MAQKVDPSVLDAALDASKGDAYFVCVGEPTDFANVAVVRVNGTSAVLAYSGKTDGLTAGGRKHEIAADQDINVDEQVSAALADHVAITLAAGSILKVVNTISNPQTVENGNQIDLGAWDHEFEGP